MQKNNSISQYVKGLQHIGLPTNDLKATVDFYEGLGFSAALRTVNPENGEAVVFLRLGDIVIEAYENGKAALRSGAIDHIALDVTDIEAVYDEIVKNGYTLLDEGIRHLPFWDNGVRFINIQGPNRETVEFSQML